MEIRLYRTMSANRSSISVMAPPRSVRNRDRKRRYQSRRYTSRIPASPDPGPTMRDRVAAAYDAHYEVMRCIAAQRFRVPASDVRPLIHDVFVAFMRHSAVIGDDRGWLVRATTNACLNYWRDRKPTEPLPDLTDTREVAADVSARVDVARLLARIPRRCRRVLWLRYVDGLSPEEIAHRCTSAASSGGYGRLLVHRCLKAVREALAATARGRSS